MPSRRTFLAIGAGALAGLAGCVTDPLRSPPSTGGTYDGDRPTLTSRDPEPLDVAGEWSQRGSGPGHDGVTDAAGVPAQGAVHWQLQRVRSGPAILAKGRLFHYAKLGENRGGEPTKTRTREPDAGTAHPVYGVPSLVAREPSEGYIEWATELPDLATGWPAVGDGLVVASTGRSIGAYDVDDGAEWWSHDLGDRPVGEPTVAGDTVYLPLSGVVDGSSGEPIHEPKVRAYALDDGDERWTTPMPERGLRLAVGGDTVVVVSHGFDGSGTVLGLSSGAGAELWRQDVSGGFFRSPAVADGTVYVPDTDGRLRALALADGSERWATDAGDGVAAADGAVYAGGDRLVALDPADGSERWTVESDEGTFGTPAVGDGAVYVGGNWADLSAVDPADGTVRWSHSFPTQTVEGDMVMRGLAAQPAVVEGGLFAFAFDGLYAFGPA